MNYNDEQIRWLLERASNDRNWRVIQADFNETFEQTRTAIAVRRCFETYVGLDMSDDTLGRKSIQVKQQQLRNSKLAQENIALQANELTLQEIEKRLAMVLEGVKYRFYKPVAGLVHSTKLKRALVAHYSDAHLGANIDKKELLINEYNSAIASRRTALFFSQLADYKISKRDSTELVLILNGDMLQGVIHNQEGNLDLMTVQFETILSVLSQGVSFLATKFPKVTVLCTTGNHDRVMHKANKQKQTAQKWDSFASMAYVALKRIFDTEYTNVNFVIEKTPYITYKVLGKHRIFVTHGDSTFNIGNVSKTVSITNIENQINRINNSELTTGDKFEAFFIGHVHFPMVLLSQTGCHIFINGCVSGTDSFAQSIGIWNNQVVQQFVEMTDKYIGDMRFVDLRQADNDERLDKIIKPEGIFLD